MLTAPWRGGRFPTGSLLAVELESWTAAVRHVPRRLRTFILPPDRGVIPVRELRSMALSFGMLLLLLAAVLSVSGLSDDEPTMLGWMVFLAAGVGSTLGTVVAFRSRAAAVITARKPEEADRAYAVRFSVSAGLAMTPSLVAIVVGLWQGHLLPFWVAVPLSAGLLAFVAPWARDVRSLQTRMDRVDLGAALMTPRTWSARDEAARRRS